VKPLIVLDAGHGGRDPGAEGVGGVIEKDVVLKLTRVVAKRMTERLRVNVFLTRTDDSYITIDRRLAFPNEAVLFLSLHANSCPDPSARGLEIFYGGGEVRPADTAGASPRAALLGKYLNDALNKRVGGVRGSARPGSFSILARNPLPSALIEIGYLTHPEEAELSQDSVYRELMADAVVDGLEAFLRAAAPPL
jgi:N-acetylmuramoyl-L-alanine amidase